MVITYSKTNRIREGPALGVHMDKWAEIDRPWCRKTQLDFSWSGLERCPIPTIRKHEPSFSFNFRTSSGRQISRLTFNVTRTSRPLVGSPTREEAPVVAHGIPSRSNLARSVY